MSDKCAFCESYNSLKKVYSFEKNHPEFFSEKLMHETTVAIVTRTWTKSRGKRHAGRTIEYRNRGCGYKLNYCPECGKDLRKTK